MLVGKTDQIQLTAIRYLFLQRGHGEKNLLDYGDPGFIGKVYLNCDQKRSYQLNKMHT